MTHNNHYLWKFKCYSKLIYKLPTFQFHIFSSSFEYGIFFLQVQLIKTYSYWFIFQLGIRPKNRPILAGVKLWSHSKLLHMIWTQHLKIRVRCFAYVLFLLKQIWFRVCCYRKYESTWMKKWPFFLLPFWMRDVAFCLEEDLHVCGVCIHQCVALCF